MAGERTLPGVGLKAFWTPGSDGWDPDMDADLRKLSALTQCSVKSATTALPGSPSNGDMYIVPSGGQAKSIAVRDNGAWVYFAPSAGWMAFVQDTGRYVCFNGTNWVDGGSAYQGTIGGRNLTISTADPSGGSNGDLWLKIPT